MQNQLIQQLIQAKTAGTKKFAELSLEKKINLEDQWDVEHAYYSSALAGSELDRSVFDELAREES